MKRNRFFTVLAAAVVLSLLMLAIPVTLGLGAIVFTISASTGPTGTSLTVTSGTGFTTPGSGYVWFDSDGDSVMDSGEPYLAATVSATNVFSAPGTMIVPTVPRL